MHSAAAGGGALAVWRAGLSFAKHALMPCCNCSAPHSCRPTPLLHGGKPHTRVTFVRAAHPSTTEKPACAHPTGPRTCRKCRWQRPPPEHRSSAATACAPRRAARPRACRGAGQEAPPQMGGTRSAGRGAAWPAAGTTRAAMPPCVDVKNERAKSTQPPSAAGSLQRHDQLLGPKGLWGAELGEVQRGACHRLRRLLAQPRVVCSGPACHFGSN